MPSLVKGKAKIGRLIRPLGLHQRGLSDPPIFTHREDVDRVGRFDRHDQVITVRRKPNLSWGPGKCRRVQATVKTGRWGKPPGVTVQEKAGAGKGARIYWLQKASGIVSGLLYLAEVVYISASP